MESYYDAHLYVANWGTRRLMFRLPCSLLDPDVVEDDTGESDFADAAEALLSAIVGVRAELAAGDLRPLYLAWLAAYGVWERDEDVFDRDAENDLEPPHPGRQ
jgi:hypothetical protein